MGNPAITLSLSDPAGQTIFELLKEKGFKKTGEKDIYSKGDIYLLAIRPLVVQEERYITPKEPDPYPEDYDFLAIKYEIDYIVVASRHWAKSGKPSLTTHPTGNFGKAMYGGRPRELQATAPNPMRDIYLRLLEDPPEKFEVSLEATHHSPTMFSVPMFFAEVGSREEQWRDTEVCNYLVESILKGIEDQGDAPIALGFGGGHYCPYFSPKMTELAFGHIAAKYAIPLLSEDLVQQMNEKSGGAELAVLDSGLKSKERNKVENLLDRIGLEIR
jgi:D-aminoacyl-tRNA deacylase